MTEWIIYEDGDAVDTVFYPKDMGKGQVKKDLVDRGYSSSIRVEKAKN